jgi:putative phosphoesterase
LKRIALLSDTHGFMDQQILSHISSCDEVWHAGDVGDISVLETLAKHKPLRAVYGNIDGQTVRKSTHLNQRFNCEGVDVWITHIGGYPGRYDLKIRDQIKRNPPKLFICGHSHILKVMSDKKLGLLHMNPGACGRNGFHKVRTLLRFTLEAGNIKDLEVVELGPRTSDDATI